MTDVIYDVIKFINLIKQNSCRKRKCYANGETGFPKSILDFSKRSYYAALGRKIMARSEQEGNQSRLRRRIKNDELGIRDGKL